MRRTMVLMSLILTGIVVPVSADSFGFYYRSHGFGMGMEFGDYDYYDSDSPGYYGSSDIDFRIALDPYGYWDYMEDFGGYVWIPSVPITWAPYTYGSWSYTNYGWTWVSYEPWGWIPHHYGRWFFHPFYRWIWLPGYEYSPAWVTWGYYNGYYAWAPLPPVHVGFYSHYDHRYYGDRYYQYNYYDDDYYEYRNSYDRSYHWYGNSRDYDNSTERWIPNDAWVMVPEKNFMSNDITQVRVDRTMASRILMSSPGQGGGHSGPSFKSMKEGPKESQVEQIIGKRIERVPVDEVMKPTKDGKTVKIVSPKGIMQNREKDVKPVYESFKKVTKKEKKAIPREEVFKEKPKSVERKPINESMSPSQSRKESPERKPHQNFNPAKQDNNNIDNKSVETKRPAAIDGTSQKQPQPKPNPYLKRPAKQPVDKPDIQGNKPAGKPINPQMQRKSPKQKPSQENNQSIGEGTQKKQAPNSDVKPPAKKKAKAAPEADSTPKAEKQETQEEVIR